MPKSFSDQLARICPDPIIGVDRAGYITLFNRAAEKLLGYDAKEVIGTLNIADIYHPPEAGREVKRLMYNSEINGYGQIQGHESALKDRNDRIVPIQISATLVMENDKEIGSIGFFHDLTLRKALEKSLKQLSITDGLTGLFNQRHFQSTLVKEIARSNRYNHPLTLVCIDMDNFKLVNDQLGHMAGDNLISFMGSLIREELRTSDYGFRYGGDEFMLLLPESGQQQSLTVAQRLLSGLVQKSPLSCMDNAPEVGISIGIAELQPKEGPEQFFRRADLAMYQAKHLGGNQAQIASDVPTTSEPATRSVSAC
ncbi:sensor domain-containing diguanylate cyclase [Motiliproteus sp. MSK22-1]|uniref:sensor domain-containing diguanylate cyclase n=1 Tax=Motiliproteus sp. MSK22-1 TaxID=1897630 RepID=UPI000975B120|nr:sensor domain-containing diguanylate cyclase [Motiliproteus sp. MSK22-1]OMH30334.1 hypothetical protein BGP75_18280 [Motiliproteus sp. MSK22-1]